MKFLSKLKRLFDPMDLTKGPIAKNILLFAIPIILSLLFQQIYVLTDATIVGKTLSEPEIAGVNNTGSLVFTVLQFGFGCASGFSVIIAEAIGKKDEAKMRSSFYLQILLVSLISLLLTIAGIALIPTLLKSLGIVPSPADPVMQKTYESAYTYLAIIYGGILCQLLYNSIVATLRSMGDSFVPFLFLLGSTLLNVALDLLFIIVFSWGVAGSAIATVLSQGLAAAGALVYALCRYPSLRYKKKETTLTGKDVWVHLKNGLPLGFQFSILAIGMIVMQASIIAFDIQPDGTMLASMPAQLGYAAACKIINLLMVPVSGLGTAFLSFAGQNYGAKQPNRLKEGLKKTAMLMFAFWAVLALIGLLLTIRGAYQYLFLSPDKITEESIAFGNVYLYVSVPSLIFLGFLFLLRFTLQGLQKPLWPFLAGMGELAARILICLFLPSLIAGGPISSSVGAIPFLGAALGDPGAWVIAPLLMIIPTVNVIKDFTKQAESEDLRTQTRE